MIFHLFEILDRLVGQTSAPDRLFYDLISTDFLRLLQ
jgi:hypothetical protein